MDKSLIYIEVESILTMIKKEPNMLFISPFFGRYANNANEIEYVASSMLVYVCMYAYTSIGSVNNTKIIRVRKTSTKNTATTTQRQ